MQAYWLCLQLRPERLKDASATIGSLRAKPIKHSSALLKLTQSMLQCS